MKKEILIIVSALIFSIIIGYLTNDLLLGTLTLATGLLSSYYASIGKRINYILGLINFLLIGYVSFVNHLYGLFFFDIFVFVPLQIKGYLAWSKHLKDNVVKVRKFTLKKGILITIICFLASLIIGYLLTLIPFQRLAFLDSASNVLDICSYVLFILRYKESWYVGLIGHIVFIAIWVFTFIDKGSNSLLMIIVGITYFLLGIYGIYKWDKIGKEIK
jgi:nicotinamide mononucleotide transporter